MVRKKELLEELEKVEHDLKQYPLYENEKLVVTQNGNYVKWYLRKNNKTKYLPKTEKAKAEYLAKKTYLQARQQDLSNELTAINSYLKHFNSDNQRTIKFLKKQAYQELLNIKPRPLDEEILAWSKEDYPKNQNFPKDLIHKSISGNILRSKSESLIDMLLYQAQIPFRYEAELKLNNKVYYPDFTIRHPKSGEYFFWEHFGMMDDSQYKSNYFSKVSRYIENGILPGKNLITTYETESIPLTSDVVARTIELFFR